MSSRTLISLAVIAGLILLSVLYQQRDVPVSVTGQAGELIFPDLAGQLNDASSLEVVSQDEAFSLVKSVEGWVAPEKSNYSVNMEQLGGFLRGLSQLTRLEPKTSNPELYAKLDLLEPGEAGTASVRYRLKNQNDEVLANILFGKQQAAKSDIGEKEYFVLIGDDPQSWLIKGKVTLHKQNVDWLQKTILEIDRSRIRRAEVLHPGQASVVVQRESPDAENYALNDIPEGKKTGYQFAVNDVATSFSLLDFDDVRRVTEIDFNEPIVANMETFDGLRIIMMVIETQAKKWVQLYAEFDETLISDPAAVSSEDVGNEITELNRLWQGWAYQLPEFRIGAIVKPKAELLEDDQDSAEGEEPTVDPQ